MKKTLIACGVLSLLSLSAQASDPTLIKTCSTVMTDGEKSAPSVIQIYRNADSSTIAKTTQTIDGVTNTMTDKAEVSEYSVRAGLTGDTGDDATIDSLNLAERIITDAMALAKDPDTAQVFKSGVDLEAIRSAKVYQIGEATSMGVAAILEAKDASGNDLGSFFGGLLVSPCK